MTLEVFAIYDSQTQVFERPFMARAKGEALRMFADVVNDEKTPYSKHAPDFALFHLGAWNDANASYELFPAPTRIILATELLNK